MFPPCCSAVACICLYFAYILYTLAYSSLYYLYNRAAAGEEQEEKEKEDFVFLLSLCFFFLFPSLFFSLFLFLFLFLFIFLFLVLALSFSHSFLLLFLFLFLFQFLFLFFCCLLAVSLLPPCCLRESRSEINNQLPVPAASLLPLCWLLAACGNHGVKSI